MTARYEQRRTQGDMARRRRPGVSDGPNGTKLPDVSQNDTYPRNNARNASLVGTPATGPAFHGTKPPDEFRDSAASGADQPTIFGTDMRRTRLAPTERVVMTSNEYPLQELTDTINAHVSESVTPETANLENVIATLRLRKMLADPSRAGLLVADNPVQETDRPAEEHEDELLGEKVRRYAVGELTSGGWQHGDKLFRTNIVKGMRAQDLIITREKAAEGVESLLLAGVLERITPSNFQTQRMGYVVNGRNFPGVDDADVSISLQADLLTLDAEILRRNVLANVQGAGIQEKHAAMEVLGILDHAVESGILPSSGEKPETFTDTSHFVLRSEGTAAESMTAFFLEQLMNGEIKDGDLFTFPELKSKLPADVSSTLALKIRKHLGIIGILRPLEGDEIERFDYGAHPYIVDTTHLPFVVSGDDTTINLGSEAMVQTAKFSDDTKIDSYFRPLEEKVEDPLHPTDAFSVPDIDDYASVRYIVAGSLYRDGNLRSARAIAKEWGLDPEMALQAKDEILRSE